MKRNRSRLAATIFEVALVMTIIGMIIPAICGSRIASRKRQCITNMKDLALGVNL